MNDGAPGTGHRAGAGRRTLNASTSLPGAGVLGGTIAVQHLAPKCGDPAPTKRAPWPPSSVVAAARALLILTDVGVMLLAGCGYHLIGATSSLPARLQKLYVAPLVNQTSRAEVDQRLTEQISQEWVRRGRFQLVSNSDQADAVLSGTVVSVNVNPVQFDQVGRATEYQLTVVADIQLVDRTGPKPIVLWHDKNFSLSQAYPVDVNATNYFDQEIAALDQLATNFARTLVVTILEGF
jgi:outer membrane lipopolysaccharide assembly protein LptE/RlpB